MGIQKINIDKLESDISEKLTEAQADALGDAFHELRELREWAQRVDEVLVHVYSKLDHSSQQAIEDVGILSDMYD